ncbi:Rcb2.42 [Mycena latifolia]|nr:Rcb2.42 [Mycena latifolia]
MPSALTAAPFIASVLVLATLPHHWRVKNIATLSIIAWLSVYDLTYGVNAVIWEGNTEIRAEAWCDIATKLKIGADAGLPGCSLCLARQLNRIASGDEMSPRGWRHRGSDIFLCWGLPVTIMVLHIIVQGHRFDIIQDIGCQPAIYVSWPSIFILDLSSFIPAVLALLYCALALHKLFRRRIAFRLMLEKQERSLSLSRYIRLMIMVFFLGSWNTVLISVSTSDEYTDGLQPWTSWSFVHADFGNISQYTLDQLSPESLRCTYVLWWAVPLSSLSFFVFFGIGEEAMKDYRATTDWAARVLLRRIPEPTFIDALAAEAPPEIPPKRVYPLPTQRLYRIPTIRALEPLVLPTA